MNARSAGLVLMGVMLGLVIAGYLATRRTTPTEFAQSSCDRLAIGLTRACEHTQCGYGLSWLVTDSGDCDIVFHARDVQSQTEPGGPPDSGARLETVASPSGWHLRVSQCRPDGQPRWVKSP